MTDDQQDQATARLLRVLVDDTWYAGRYPDVRATGLDPLQHYIQHGAAEGRDPNPFFDGEWYLQQYPDVGPTGIPPLLHYVTVGAAQLRNPHPRFDAGFYVRSHPEAARNPLLAHLTAGLQRGWPTEESVDFAAHLPSDGRARTQFSDTIARFRASGLPCILMVSHPLGGGIRRHVAALVARLARQANVLMLQAPEWGVSLSVPASPDHDVLTVATARIAELADFLRALPVVRVHVHHTAGLDSCLRELLHHLRVPFDVTLHDYYAICPQVNLLPERDGATCGEPGPDACNACIANRPSHGARDITSWRLRHAWLFLEADRVLCPSKDAAARLQRYAPSAKVVIAPHEPDAWPSPKIPNLGRRGEGLRVALIGTLAPHKGLRAAVEVVRAAAPSKVTLHLIGAPEDALPPDVARRIQITGAYADENLPDMIARARPHVAWFPSTWPETYSYTLSAALAAGLPIVASRIGAFPERLEGRALTWLCDAQTTTADWLAVFETAHAALRNPAIRRPTEPERDISDFYDRAYAAPLAAQHTPRRLVDLRRPGRLSVVIVPETFGNGMPTPCAYIRLLLPLSHPAIASGIDVVMADADTARHYRADVIATQRHAVPDGASAKRLAAHCRRQGIALLYDLDDDLIDVGPEHPEYAELQPKAALVAQLVETADAVWVSTSALGDKLAGMGRHATIVANGLDERIWAAPSPSPSPNSGPLRILYMGSATHDADFALVAPALARLVGESSGRVAFDMIGVSAKPDMPPWVNRVPMPVLAAQSYPGFVGWAARRGGWDVGVAPLADTPFNRCKSAIKAMDYAGMGLPIIASDMPAFRGSLADGRGGMLAANTDAAWYDALALLINNPQLRTALAADARAALRARHTLRSQAAERRALWHALAGAPVSRAAG
jgi:glycosyltransferase involved in cell wall biosynthesis